MINKIYLIQAHQYPEQLFRMINRLNEEGTLFYIHIDFKSDLNEFQKIIKGENIFFIENRVDCIWGDFSQVQATLNMIQEVLKIDYNPNTRVVLLSGQDYPIKSLDFINDFFEKHEGFSFINIENITQSGSHHLKNLKAFKLNHSSQRYDFTMISKYHYKSIIKGIINRKIQFKDLVLIFKTKKLPFHITFYRGSNWFSFNYLTLQKIIDFYNDHKNDLEFFFKQTLCPDEIFFHSILIHLKKDDNTINIMPSLTYDNWIREGVELPVTFKKKICMSYYLNQSISYLLENLIQV
ncbi:glycosyl transferase family 14 [Chryseobacterium capnotolerans]|uniref:beta-1,6-N-acetylglucosaminyltransferase n=1 Tax=Chryseobacterium capnotolerans TaxID=2759528 RepID=UPI001E3230EE|nr:beta-1,6-N-acetylglucosaminyltransferase [Chryseobacterium capnotolerans]UHO39172.1 glycosyl transferase family 14 [Chryseobacterium capnotolerans]